MGKTPARSTPAFWNGTNAWVSISDLTSSDKYISQTRECITDDAITRTGIKKVPKDTLLMSFKLSLGKVAITATDIYTNEAIMAFIDKEKYDVDIHYMYHYFQAIDWTIGTNKAVKGVTLNKIVLSEKVIELPPINIQHEIAERMDNLNAVTKNLQHQLTLLDELVKSRFIELFGDPVTNPKGWKTNLLKNLGELNRGVSKHRPRNDPELLNGSYPLVQTGDVSNADTYIKEYSSTYSEVGLKQSRMWSKGTLCITIAANIAKTGILTFDACFPDSVVGFIPGEQTNQIYIHHWFSFFQKILEEQAPQSAQKNINLQILGNLSVMLPPLALQNEFAAFVEQADKSKFAVLMHRQILLKTALLSAMFSSYTNSDRRICKSLHRRSVDNDEL